jgi:hypothetical protein
MSPIKKRNSAVAILFLALIAVITIAGVFTKFRLDQEQAFFWDICIKAVGGFVAIAGALLTLAKYLSDRRAAQREPFEELRGSVYSKLVQATATIGNYPPESKARKEADKSFWVLYWGEVPMIVDEEVAAIVDKFHDAVSDKKNDEVLLRNLSMDLARACRKSLGFDVLPRK